MRRLAPPVLIKLGGSIITFKEKPLQANLDSISRISKEMLKLDIPVIIVHGGGSFGHYWSVKYDMHTEPSRYDKHGISVVHESMIALNQTITNYMLKEGLSPYGVMPSCLLFGQNAQKEKIIELENIAQYGLIPVTFGDVIAVGQDKYSILSGDVLMTVLAGVIKPERVIFAVNVDGIYQNMEDRELIRVIDPAVDFDGRIKFSQVNADVTGGMVRKVSEALKISSMGINVFMVNGLHPERIIDAVKRDSVFGTVIKAGK